MTHQSTPYPLDYGESAKTKKSASNGVHDPVEQVAADMMQRAQEYTDKARETLGQVKPFLDRSVKDQPMATLAAMAAVGFVLGALWRR